MRSEEDHSLGTNDLETCAESLSVAETERRTPSPRGTGLCANSEPGAHGTCWEKARRLLWEPCGPGE